MTFLPIIRRELGIRARARATYRTRVAVAAIGLLLCLPQLASIGPFSASAAVGKTIFAVIITGAFMLSCCACFLTVASMHSEQQEGTLSLLLLTRVNLLDVLLGKLGSIGLTSLCALVAFSPVLMLPILAGGVTGGEAFRQALVSFNTMFYSLVIGLFASAGHRSLSRAAKAAGALMLLAVLVPAAFRVWTNDLKYVGLVSPLVALISATDKHYSAGSAWEYWVSMLGVQALGWLWLIAAVSRLRRGLREPGTAPPRRASWRRSDIPTAPPRRWQTVSDKTTPIQWLVRRQPGMHASIWAAAVVDLIMRTLLTVSLVRPGNYLFYLLPSLISSAISGTLIAWAASRFFMDARHSGQLELLLTTPVGASTIVSDQWKALRHILIWPAVVMLFPVVLRLVMMLPMALRGSPGVPFAILYSPVSLVLEITGTLLSIGALAWLGLFFGFRVRSHAAAVGWSVALARGFPYVFAILAQMALFAVVRPVGNAVFSFFVFLLIPLTWQAGLWWLICSAKRRLVMEVSRADPGALKDSFPDTWRTIRSLLRRARDWPPTIR
ncbi:MAG TPA: hypothetical protein VJA21_08295 [Verrucomicrobiae bacterium]